MSQSEVGGQDTRACEDLARAATTPARWLLDLAADSGVPLTQIYALARAIVREAAERWPEWWDADLFGPTHREADMAVLEALHEGVRRLRLVRRRGRKLHATAGGRKLAGDPTALLYELALDLGGGDPFSAIVADEVIDTLGASAFCTHDQLVEPAHQAARLGGWRDPAGNPPGERNVSWVVADLLRQGEAYGLVERQRSPDDPRSWRWLISLSPAAALVVGSSRSEVSGRTVFVFEAELEPPLRRWAARRILRANPSRFEDMLRAARAFEPRHRDALVHGLLDAADGLDETQRRSLIRRGLESAQASVRCTALDCLCALAGPETASRRARADTNASVRQWHPPQQKLAPSLLET